MTPASFGLLLISVTLGSFGQICMKTGLRGRGISTDGSIVQTFLHILQAMASPYVILGILLYVVSTFVWILILSRVRLSVAYPMISMGYVLVVVLSAAILKEHVDWRFAVTGLLCIVTGVSLIGLGVGGR
ncbi:MAG: hypothetical protein A2Z18_02985 [Armatimonadetes bacterium RBG_16_58_9]|nr:MAG: hypothetical protein A2Z18_02985 [Armatimonadetes bacterium RBG_16_58_9]